MRDDTGVPVVNSRDVAETFKGEDRRAFDLTSRQLAKGRVTRDGFTLLVMGFTGERAMAPPRATA